MCDLVKIADSVAFVCGGKRDHECNEDAEVMEDSTGKRYLFKTHILAREFYELNWDKINICMSSVACSICGDAAFDNAWKMEE